MNRIFKYILTIFIWGAAVAAFAQYPSTIYQTTSPDADSVAISQMRRKMAEIRKQRPTVALVLAGGGAKGAAHTGVIRYIESLGIPVDMVLGTSMGGLVGGMYSIGYTPDQIDSIMVNMDWGWVLTDKLSRKYISYADAKYKEKYLLSIPFYYEKEYYNLLREDARQMQFHNTGGIQHKHQDFHLGADANDDPNILVKNLVGSLPSGYIFGQNVNNLISMLTVGYHDEMNFQDLPIPFFCIAADVVSRGAKIWHKGKLHDALRSTMSIPGVFAPVRVDGMVLVDGGLRDNYPVGLARDMGADIIIGVDVSSDISTYADINNIIDIFGQAMNLFHHETFDKNLKVPHIRIRPDLTGYSMMSFNKEAIDSIIVRGKEAAVQHDSVLRKIAEKTAAAAVSYPRESAVTIFSDSLVISAVEIKGVFPKEEELLKKKINIKDGQKISVYDLENVVATIYGTKAYDYVTYELLGTGQPYKLDIKCRKGPVHQFGLGIRADTEEVVSLLVNIGLNAHKLQGHMFDFVGRISTNPYLKLQWSYDNPKLPTVNLSTDLRWTDVGMLDFGTNKLSLSYLSTRQELFFSNMKWRLFDIKGGLRNEYINIRNIKSSEVIGDYNLIYLKNDYLSLFLDARADTFDDGYFPSKGINTGASYSWTFAGAPIKVGSFHTICFDFKGVIPMGRVVALIPSLDCRFLIGDEIPLPFLNVMGGSRPGRYLNQQLPFIGITNITAMNNILTIFAADLRVQVARNHYISGIVNYARDAARFDEYFIGHGHYGAALQYSFDTIFGPLSANLHWSCITNKVGFYLSAGYNF